MSTNEIQQPTNSDIPKTRIEWVWMLWRVVPVIIVMGFALWILFTWVKEDRAKQDMRYAEQNERMEKYEAKYDALDKYVRNQFTPAIEKNNRILEEVSRKLDRNN